jgi:hypothetical protein
MEFSEGADNLRKLLSTKLIIMTAGMQEKYFK